MADESTAPVPDVSEPAHDQRAASGQLPVQHVAPITEVLTGRDFTASLAGMAAESKSLTLNRIGVLAMNAAVGLIEKARDDAVYELREEREHSADLQDRLTRAEVNVGRLEASRATDRSNTGLRLVVSAIGSVVLGFTPYAFDKWGTGAAIGTGVLGAVLVVIAWLFKPARSA